MSAEPARAPADFGAARGARRPGPDALARPLQAPRGRHRRRGRVRWGRVAALAAVVAAATFFTVVVSNRLTAPPPPGVVQRAALVDLRVPGPAPALPWPQMGEAAVAVPAIGFSEQSGAEKPVPVASLTKIMTAYIILRDHPLPALGPGVSLYGPDPPGTDGPSITITQEDQTIFDDDSGSDQSNAPVVAGEHLTERQMVEALLVHSANNLADALAIWDDGSQAAFVAKMNATAAELGMHSTHFVDASGFDPGSVSTAADLLKVTAVAMAEPAFARAVTMTTVTLPIAGTMSTYTPLIGTGHVVGVKSGFTTQAGGCVVTAITHEVDGRSLIVVAAVLGQQGYDVLNKAGLSALNLDNRVAATIDGVQVLAPGTVAATVSAAGHSVPAVTSGSVTMLAWPGQVAVRTISVLHRPCAGSRRGTEVGMVHVILGPQSVWVPARTSTMLPPETLVQRLL